MTDPDRRVLPIEPLDAHRFQTFGDVIEAADRASPFTINEGWARRFDDLARIDTGREGGHTRLSIFRAKARPLPLRLSLMERHQLGSQAFMALAPRRFLVVVAPPGPQPYPALLRCFVAAPGQGVNYAPGTWHHPLIAIDADTDFVVIDRGGPQADDDCDEVRFDTPPVWVQP
ncbi:MAG TPA: ureidoglycolate lyase [Piscinibacter sp.]|nr:ureidoglycolate lyase [Piscinibacter sp.]